MPLIELPGIILPGKRVYRAVFTRYLRGTMGFADGYHVALMERFGITDIFSFDAEFNRIPELTRRET